MSVPPSPTPMERQASHTQSGGGSPGGMVCLWRGYWWNTPEETEEWCVIPLANRITMDQTPGPSLFCIVRPVEQPLCCR